MNTLPRTRLRNRDAWFAVAVVLIGAVGGGAAHAAELRCSLTAPASVAARQPVPLRFTLMNRGAAAVQVLEWGTPLEGWFAAYVDVSRDGATVPYRGPMVKRGDPAADEYLRIPAGGKRRAEVDLAQPFDLTVPGVYRVRPRITLFDVVAAGTPVPRPRDQLVSQTLNCPELQIEVKAR